MHSEANQHAACADHIFQVDCKLHVISERDNCAYKLIKLEIKICIKTIMSFFKIRIKVLAKNSYVAI
jgi:hypothetical protein